MALTSLMEGGVIAKDIMVRVLLSEIAQQYMFSKAGVPAFAIHALLSLKRTKRNSVCCLKLFFSHAGYKKK